MLARLTVSTSVVVAWGVRCLAPLFALLRPDGMTGSGSRTRKPRFSARCWNGASCERPGGRRRGLAGGAQDGRRELVVLGVERVRGRRQPDDRAQLAALA